MSSIEKQFSEMTREIRQTLATVNYKERVEFGFRSEGYPCHGEFKVEFYIKEGYGHEVKSQNPNTAVREFLRRKGYDETETPLLLTHSDSTPEYEEPKLATASDDDISF